MRGTFTTKTPSLAKAERSTVYTLARTLTTSRFLSSGKYNDGVAYSAPYGVMDVIEMHVTSNLHYVKGLVFSNDI